MHLKDLLQSVLCCSYTHTHTPRRHTCGLYTIGDEDASQHGAKDNAESDRLEAQRRHVTPCCKRSILLLQDREEENQFSFLISKNKSLNFVDSIKTFCWHSCYKNSDGAYLLLKEHGVDGLPARQDHHGESHSHRHHETHSNHLRDQTGREVHEDISSDVLRETHVTKEAHLVSERRQQPGWNVTWPVSHDRLSGASESVCKCCFCSR